MKKGAKKETVPTELHLSLIREALEDGITTADFFNKVALETKVITLAQYQAGARLIVEAYLAL